MTSPRRLLRQLQMWLALATLLFMAQAQALTPIADAELSSVHGRDGIAFNLFGFGLSGNLNLSITNGLGSGITLGSLALSRSDDFSTLYSDPYTLTLSPRSNGLPDMVNITEPLNAAGALKWQFAADLTLMDSSNLFNAGALLVQDWVSRGGTIDISASPDANVEGIVLGLGLRLDVGAVTLRARGRGDTSLLNDPASPSQLSLQGLHIAGATSDGQLDPAKPWQMADVSNQPLMLNAITDSAGSSYIHLNLAWPSGGQAAPSGSLLIDNISFKSDVGANMDLGSSRIGSMQIQYLDVRLRAGR